MLTQRETGMILERINSWMGLQQMTQMAVPEHLIVGLQRYAEAHVPTGSFLRAVLENDLKEAIGRADAQNQILLPAIVSWCYNNLPSNVWGSVERVRDHLAAKPGEPAQQHSTGEVTSG